jgi:hypothetical protein
MSTLIFFFGEKRKDFHLHFSWLFSSFKDRWSDNVVARYILVVWCGEGVFTCAALCTPALQ